MALNETITISRLGYPQFIPDSNTDLSQSNLTNYTADIAAGTMVQFSFDYNWINTTTCKITNIKWEPCRFNDNGKIIYKKASGENIVFDAEGFEKAKLNIYFGQIDDNNKYKIVNKTLNTVNTATLSDNTIEVEGANYIPVSFIYSYVGTSSQATYSITIENIKILRPSKYEQNVVFNKDGLNELIDNIKKYPVTKVEKNNRYGYIKVTHGNNPDNPVDVEIQGFRYSTTSNLFCETNFLPYTGNGHNLGELYLPLYTPDDYRADKTYYKKEGNSYVSLGNLSQKEVTNIMTGTTGQPAITPLYTTHKWKNLYLSGDIGSSSATDKIGNIYATNGNFSDNITAKTLNGLFKGTVTGNSININDKFIVDNEGNVHMTGDITWGSHDPVQCVYHRPFSTEDLITPPNPPADGRTSFNNNAVSDWHKVVQTEDFWASMTYNGGKNWEKPIRINAVDGTKGEDGAWDADSILVALKQAQARGDIQGIIPFDNGKKIGLNAEVVLAKLASFAKIEMDSGAKYNGKDATSMQGGFITFAVPTPFTSTSTLNNSGWVGRLGYLRGNGDGNTATAGLGFVIHTKATWGDKYSNTANATVQIKSDGTTAYIGNKLHLVLATLMLTQSGLGLMFAINTTANNDGTGSTWLNNDNLVNGTKGHYSYKYTVAGTTTWTVPNDAEKYWRLWIHEDNGGLYYSDANENSKIKPWKWNGY